MSNVWDYDQTGFYNGATRGGPIRVGLCLDDGYLEVTLEAGSGYMREEIGTSVPTDVLVKILEHAGFMVTK